MTLAAIWEQNSSEYLVILMIWHYRLLLGMNCKNVLIFIMTVFSSRNWWIYKNGIVWALCRLFITKPLLKQLIIDKICSFNPTPPAVDIAISPIVIKSDLWPFHNTVWQRQCAQLILPFAKLPHLKAPYWRKMYTHNSFAYVFTLISEYTILYANTDIYLYDISTYQVFLYWTQYFLIWFANVETQLHCSNKCQTMALNAPRTISVIRSHK